MALSFKIRAFERDIGFPGNFIWVWDIDYDYKNIEIFL